MWECPFCGKEAQKVFKDPQSLLIYCPHCEVYTGPRLEKAKARKERYNPSRR